MGFIGYNKRFMWAAVGAPGSIHNSTLKKLSNLFPNQCFNLSPYREIPLTIGDSAFPSRPWLLKPYQEGTGVLVEKHFNTRLSSARVVTEHVYGMLKGRWRLLYKKMECDLENIQVVVMTCILLHNICIAKNDPCNPRWKLKVDELNLVRGNATQPDDPDAIKTTITNWLWKIRTLRSANHESDE